MCVFRSVFVLCVFRFFLSCMCFVVSGGLYEVNGRGPLCKKKPERWNVRTPERGNGISGIRNAGMLERGNVGTSERRNAGTPERGNVRTPERWNAKTPECRNAGMYLIQAPFCSFIVFAMCVSRFFFDVCFVFCFCYVYESLCFVFFFLRVCVCSNFVFFCRFSFFLCRFSFSLKFWCVSFLASFRYPRSEEDVLEIHSLIFLGSTSIHNRDDILSELRNLLSCNSVISRENHQCLTKSRHCTSFPCISL